MGTIVIGVDGSEGSAHALQWAVTEAAHHGWNVRAVLAWGFLDQHHSIVAEQFDPDYTPEDAKEALSTYLDEALGAEAAAAIERLVVSDLPARALIDASEGAQLLVVGARGLGGFKGLLLGSVSQRCLHQAKCPVAVIRPDETDPPANVLPRVVVGVDGSPAARHALTWAADEARARHATLEVIHAWQPPFVGGFPFTAATVDFSMFEDSARELVDTVVDEVDVSGLDRPVERTLMCTGAASAMLEAAHRAHVVVVGARGLGGVQRFLLGSISHQVALHAMRPVVVVPCSADGD
jgi:nucleotide-binding universal stress UspA family protein